MGKTVALAYLLGVVGGSVVYDKVVDARARRFERSDGLLKTVLLVIRWYDG
jgi:hypothetical protein